MNSALLNTLAAKGCEVQKMLDETYMGMEEFYEKMLRRLPESTALARARKSVEDGDVNACFEATHELKGLYGTLGLTPAYRACCEIVEIVRPRAGFGDTAAKLEALEKTHQELLAVIAATK